MAASSSSSVISTALRNSSALLVTITGDLPSMRSMTSRVANGQCGLSSLGKGLRGNECTLGELRQLSGSGCEKGLREVFDEALRGADERIEQANTRLLQMSLVEAGQKWMTRFGIDVENDPEADVKLEVARRKGVLFVMVVDRCFAKIMIGSQQWKPPPETKEQQEQEREAAIADFNKCLAREEKVEAALGNSLTEPPAR
jgi:hypothetical protein